MANVRGIFNTSKYESGIKKLDVRDMIFELQSDETPFISILGKLGKSKAVDTEFSWFEDDLLANYTQVNYGAGYDGAATSIVVDDATIFQENDIVKNMTSGECYLITAITDATNTLTISRAFGSTTAASIVNDDYLYKLGNAQAEAYTAPDSLVTAKTKKTNFVQIFSKTVTVSETADNVDTWGGNRRNFERNKKAVELKREIESQMVWGEPKEDTSGTHPRRQTGGVYYFMSTTSPSLDMSSHVLTESAWEGFLKDVFTYSGKDRYAFTGPLILSQISQFASGKQRLTPEKDATYGISVRKYISAMGIINLVLDRHFIGPHAGKALILDVNEIKYRYLQNSDWKLALNIQPSNVHYVQDEYSCTIGCEFHQAKLHGHVKGVTAS